MATVVTVITAEKLSKAQLATVRELVEKKVGAVEIKQELDPQILGGMKLRIGDQELDGSLSGRLDQLESTQDVATVITAVPLTADQRRQVTETLHDKYGELELEEVVDPTVIGGISIRVGSRVFDATLRSKLDRLKYTLLEAL